MTELDNRKLMPKGKNLKPLKQAIPYLKPYRKRLLWALICLLVASAASLAMPIALRHVIDYGFSSEHTDTINQYFVALLVLGVVFAVFGALRYYSVMWIGERFVADLRRKVFEHIVLLDATFFEETRTGEVLSRLTTDTTLVQSVFGAGMSIALRSFVTFVGAFIMLFFTSMKLAGMIFLLLPFVVLPILLYGKKIRALSRTSQDRVADTSGIAGESLNAINILQAFTLEKLFGKRFADAVEVAFAAARRRLFMSALLSFAIILSAFTAIIIVLWIGAQAVIAGTISPGTLGQFLLYATFVAGSTTALGEVWGDMQRASGAMERLLELLQTEPEIKSPVNAVIFGSVQGRINMENVTFYYPSRPEHAALENFSLQVQPGENVALVGPSGAGKSTVLQLLMRFYDPQIGRVLLDDVDIKSADLNDVRRCIGIVPQNTVLFAGTAMENIRYGRPDASDEEVLAAAKAALVDEFVQCLPQGYDTFLGEKGVRLSGGQQQRVAIARAMLKDPPVLLLDEATSALDAESERLVQLALQHLMQNRTTIVIAHRLATVKKADRILVMTEGQILEQGRHAELMQKDGLYVRLADLQFGQDKSAIESLLETAEI